MSGCPWGAEIQYCPLYLAAHVGDGNSCDDGRLDEGGCAVSRGMSYRRAMLAIVRRRWGVSRSHRLIAPRWRS